MFSRLRTWMFRRLNALAKLVKTAIAQPIVKATTLIFFRSRSAARQQEEQRMKLRTGHIAHAQTILRAYEQVQWLYHGLLHGTYSMAQLHKLSLPVTTHALTDEDSYFRQWVNKLISYVYRKGAYHPQKGQLITPDAAAAERYKTTALATLQEEEEKLTLSVRYFYQQALQHDDGLAFDYLKAIAQTGHRLAQVYLAYIIEKKYPAYSSLSLYYYLQASQAREEDLLSFGQSGRVEAQRRLALWYTEGKQVPKSAVAAAHYTYLAALHDDPQAFQAVVAAAQQQQPAKCLQLGLLYLQGTQQIPADPKQAVRLLQQAIKSGQLLSPYAKTLCTELCLKLARYYETYATEQPDITEVDYLKAMQIAAYAYNIVPFGTPEYTQAQFQAGNIYYAVLNQLENALPYFGRLSVLGDQDAQRLEREITKALAGAQKLSSRSSIWQKLQFYLKIKSTTATQSSQPVSQGASPPTETFDPAKNVLLYDTRSNSTSEIIIMAKEKFKLSSETSVTSLSEDQLKELVYQRQVTSASNTANVPTADSHKSPFRRELERILSEWSITLDRRSIFFDRKSERFQELESLKQLLSDTARVETEVVVTNKIGPGTTKSEQVRIYNDRSLIDGCRAICREANTYLVSSFGLTYLIDMLINLIRKVERGELVAYANSTDLVARLQNLDLMSRDPVQIDADKRSLEITNQQLLEENKTLKRTLETERTTVEGLRVDINQLQKDAEKREKQLRTEFDQKLDERLQEKTKGSVEMINATNDDNKRLRTNLESACKELKSTRTELADTKVTVDWLKQVVLDLQSKSANSVNAAPSAGYDPRHFPSVSTTPPVARHSASVTNARGQEAELADTPTLAPIAAKACI